jgi:hypothetical protein
MDDEHGFVAIEWVAAIALLLLPVVVLVATLPTWVERRHTAIVAAREAARVLAQEWPNADERDARVTAEMVAADHDVDLADVTVRVFGAGAARGDLVRVEVDVMMPAISVVGMTGGRWISTAVAVRRIDDYRSR